jgi:hypothetical protein
MKITHCILALLVISITFSNKTYSQLYNGSFENWSSHAGTGGSYVDPDSVTTPNQYSLLASTFLVSKTTSAHHGSFACDLETKHISYLTINGDYPGIITNGSINLGFFTGGAGSPILGGKKINYRPTHFTGWYKYISLMGDSARVDVLLTKWVAGVGRDTIGSALFIDSIGVANYTNFILPISYTNASIPDTFQYTISSGGRNFAHIGSKLTIDSINFYPQSGNISVANQPIQTSINVYPNPTSKSLTIVNGFVSNETANFAIYDIAGKQLVTANYINQTTVNTSILPSGHYILKISLANNVINTQPIQIAH